MAEQSIGKVAIVYGNVKAISQDGVERVLQPNSPIFLMDRVNTGADGAISIVFNDSADTQLDLGRMTDMVIDKSILGSNTIYRRKKLPRSLRRPVHWTRRWLRYGAIMISCCVAMSSQRT